MEKELPASSYIQEEAKNLTQTRLLWLNESYLQDHKVLSPGELPDAALVTAFLQQTAWGIPNANDPAEAFGALIKIYFSDRYGGSKMGNNFGSGRAAEAGAWQNKGPGQTHLLAETPQESHVNGTVPMEEGMREVVWGEVNKDSPHGANRVIALIDRGTWTKLPNGTYQRDVIVVRESSLRPAHFMRATFGEGKLQKTDEERTRNAVSKIADLLPQHKAGTAGATSTEKILNGLQEYTLRLAEQYAYLFAHKFYHGAASPSNIDLSGKLLDYGTQTAQPGYGLMQILSFVDPAGKVDDIVKTQLVEFLEELRIHLPPEIAQKLPTAKNMERQFLSVYRQALREQFLELTGAPPEIAQALVQMPKHSAFAELLIATAVSGAKKSTGRYNVPDRLQRYELSSLLTRLAEASGNPEKWESLVKEELPGWRAFLLRPKFLNAYRAWMNAVENNAQENGINKTDLQKKVAENARKQNRKIAALYRWNMMDENFKVLEEYNRTLDPSLVRDTINSQISAWQEPQKKSSSANVELEMVEQGIHEGTGIAPNEFRHDLFLPYTSKKEGIYVGVGSFRVDNETANGNFSKIVKLDYDEKVSAHNLLNLELQNSYDNRREYLAKLLLGEVPEDLQGAVLGEGKDKDFVKKLAAKVSKGEFSFEKLEPSLRPETAKILKTLIADGTMARVSQELATTDNQWGYSALDRYFENGTWEQTLFGSDRIFRQVRKNIAEGKYLILNGSIASKKTADYLRNLAQKIDSQISILDISNADSHVVRDPHLTQSYLEFLRSLPFSADAQLLSTSKAPSLNSGLASANPKLDHWRYFAHAPADYTHRLEQALTAGRSPKEALLITLSHGRTDLDGIQPGDWEALQSKIRSRVQEKAAVKNPVIIVVAGSMGAGKSTVFRQLHEQGILDRDQFVVADADVLKEQFPSMKNSADKNLMSDHIHRQSTLFNNQLARLAAANQRNVVFFSSFRDLERAKADLEDLRRASPNAKLVLAYVDTPVETALFRNDKRLLAGLHNVPPDKVLESGKNSRQVYENLKDLFFASVHLNNSKESLSVSEAWLGYKKLKPDSALSLIGAWIKNGSTNPSRSACAFWYKKLSRYFFRPVQR